jgi:penicillin-binding protein 1B
MARRHKRFALLAALVGALCALAAVVWVRRLDGVLRARFEGRRFAIPSRVYADSAFVFPGLDLKDVGFFARLERLGYREVEKTPLQKGDFRRGRDGIEIFLRDFSYPRHAVPDRRVLLRMQDGVVAEIRDLASAEEVFSLELEPELVTGLHEGRWEQRRLVTLAEVPPLLVRAILATEDQRFFAHHGIDPRGILRAAAANLLHGELEQGGSTLTQQLMKNFFLTPERSARRKIREIALALRAEALYTKNDILECYLNEIYLGQNGAQAIHGIWEASHFYFAKAPNRLSLAEVALLAGLVRGPNLYSPFRNPERARKRRDTVLGLLATNGVITREEYAAAVIAPLRQAPPRRMRRSAPYFVDLLYRELARDYSKDVLHHEGLDFFTTIDMQLQRAAEDAVANGLAALEKAHPRLSRGTERVQAALVALRPQTGAIVALVGGRDYAASQFNRAVDARRQPGSVFKPFVYLAAFEAGLASPSTTLIDEPFEWQYDRRSWRPRNYKDTYYGPVSARFALAHSLNAATAHLAQQVGLARIRQVANDLGLAVSLPEVPSMILGAFEASPLQIARAYAAIANQGTATEPRLLKRVVDPGGELIESRPAHATQVAGAEATYLLTDMLAGAIDFGTGRGVRERGFALPAAGKTGTTNESRDAWFAGFTPNLVAVVWVGFDRDDPLGLTGAQAALPIWTAFMTAATAGTPARQFAVPAGIERARIDPLTAELAAACPHSVVEIFPRGQVPRRLCREHTGPPIVEPASSSQP